MLQNLYEGYSYVPSDAAIKYKNSIINYGRLNEHLIECSKMFSCMNCATTVLIMMDKGVEIVIATISVFLSKNVFCILDKNITEITFNEIIEETKSSVIFTDLKNSKRIEKIAEQYKINIVVVDFNCETEELSISQKNIYDIRRESNINIDDSHIIYTSGSTSKPKGIICSRSSMWSFIKWEYNYLQLDSKVNVSQMSAPWFEPYLRDVFLALFSGGCICIPTKREEFDPKAFYKFVEKMQIDVLHIVPTLFRYLFFNEKLGEHNIKHILLAGEMLYGADVRKYYEKYDFGNLYNLYGPTETTMAKFCYKISTKDQTDFRIKVGKPLPDTEFWLLNENGKLAENKQIGEVIISTKQGTYGYLDKSMTKNVFGWLDDGTTIFKTGDIGYVDNEDNLELVGRKDYMQKIYGQKVYPEEIEGVINICANVKKSMVFIDNNKIIALIESNDYFDIDELVYTLTKNLIAYKHPHFIYVVENIPVNKSGKIDRNRFKSCSDINYKLKFII